MPRENRVAQMVSLQSPAGDLSRTHCHAHTRALPSSGWGGSTFALLAPLHPDDAINLP